MNTTLDFSVVGPDRGNASGLGASREAIGQLGRLSGAASQRGDMIFRSLQVANDGQTAKTPFLGTDAGNAALQGFLSAGLHWLQRSFGAGEGAAAAAATGSQLVLPLGP